MPPITNATLDLAVDLAGLRLANPLMTASGTCGYADEYADFVDLARLGAFVTKSITPEPRKGNAPQRIVETRAGMLNAIGLANVGHEAFVRDKLPRLAALRDRGPRIIVNVAGHSIDEYVRVAGDVAGRDMVDAVELNVSCPNVKDGLTFGTSPALLREVVGEVAGAVRGHAKLVVKLSPNVGDITATARAAVEAGADVLSLINTYTAMAVDVNTRRPRIANGTGGLSGPAIRPLAVHLTSRVYREVAREANVPIIGMGGIQQWQDAAEFLLAGATGLAVGTALFVDPATPVRVIEGVEKWLEQQGVTALRDVIGTLELPGDVPAEPYP
ncbi:MAG: dihydroorotate dehydrogenase [Phycisphaeraceae bacterium]